MAISRLLDRARAFRGTTSLAGFTVRGRFVAPALSLAGLVTGARAAHAQTILPDAVSATAADVIAVAVFAGLVGAAIFSAMLVIRERSRISDENTLLRGKIADLNAALQRSESLLNVKGQCLLVWRTGEGAPEMLGALDPDSGLPSDRAALQAYGRWLTADSAGRIERAVVALRDGGTPFETVLEARNGRLVEAIGQISANHAILRFASVSQAHEEHAQLKAEYARMADAFSTLENLSAALDAPAWRRDTDGNLVWVNMAYARAVEADSPEQAIAEGRELLSTPTREEIRRARTAATAFHKKVSAVVAGDRHQYQVHDVTGRDGSAGLAIDVTGIELLREEYERAQRSHSETLDQLNTAVAIFDANQKLRFHNLAFQKLWDLDIAYLASAPEHALVLDRLRSEGQLPEQPEWRRWKENLLSAYQTAGSQEHWWHLPDGRTIRVIANPQPKGGVTWVFENLTERMDLESRYKTAVRVQGETLDNLAEGVAVFGADGRIRLSNPAFAELWNLPTALARESVHISAVRAACDPLAKDSPWADFVAAATGFDEQRDERTGKIELNDGTILGYGLIPLPNGQMMMTFVDITDSANVELALKEKNDALQKADAIKDEFIQHVSYELRSPLTNIIGFTELLAMGAPGPLTDKQRDYVDHIATSSSVLLTIVNDILDLATVDAGIMQLELAHVDVGQAAHAAGEMVSGKLAEHSIRLDIRLDEAPEYVLADETRLRQILFNLLSNAADYAPEGTAITLTVSRQNEGVVFAVHDDGPGMSQEVLDAAFQRFRSGAGGRRRGAGLGLSIVKSFMDLHGGAVSIETGEEKGTTVSCLFPAAPQPFQAAAE